MSDMKKLVENMIGNLLNEANDIKTIESKFNKLKAKSGYKTHKATVGSEVIHLDNEVEALTSKLRKDADSRDSVKKLQKIADELRDWITDFKASVDDEDFDYWIDRWGG